LSNACTSTFSQRDVHSVERAAHPCMNGLPVRLLQLYHGRLLREVRCETCSSSAIIGARVAASETCLVLRSSTRDGCISHQAPVRWRAAQPGAAGYRSQPEQIRPISTADRSRYTDEWLTSYLCECQYTFSSAGKSLKICPLLSDVSTQRQGKLAHLLGDDVLNPDQPGVRLVRVIDDTACRNISNA
jgi:hypothetical protein